MVLIKRTPLGQRRAGLGAAQIPTQPIEGISAYIHVLELPPFLGMSILFKKNIQAKLLKCVHKKLFALFIFF